MRADSFVEASWATLIKPAGRILDLGILSSRQGSPHGKFDFSHGAHAESTTLRAGLDPELARNAGAVLTRVGPYAPKGLTRGPPLLPETFTSTLDDKAFARESDRAVAAKIYLECFKLRIASVETLEYESLGWGDEEVRVVMRLLLFRGGLPNLRSLSLKGNCITDNGATTLSRLVALCALPKLQGINVAGNRLGKIGQAILIRAQKAHGVKFDISRNKLAVDLWRREGDTGLQSAKARLDGMRASAMEGFERALDR